MHIRLKCTESSFTETFEVGNGCDMLFVKAVTLERVVLSALDEHLLSSAL